MMNTKATMRLNQRWNAFILPIARPMELTLNASSQATKSTGNAVAMAKTNGKRYPPLSAADIGMSIPK